MKRVLKWNIPVDDEAHRMGAGRVIHVQCQFGISDVVQVWTEEDFEKTTPDMLDVQIFGTGHTFPDDWFAVGSVIVEGGHLVWHVVQHWPAAYGGYIKR